MPVQHHVLVTAAPISSRAEKGSQRSRSITIMSLGLDQLQAKEAAIKSLFFLLSHPDFEIFADPDPHDYLHQAARWQSSTDVRPCPE